MYWRVERFEELGTTLFETIRSLTRLIGRGE
jgi:hypothetical protein